MKRAMILRKNLILLHAVLWMSFAQSSPAAKLATLAPPTNVRVEAGENAIKVMWDASPDEAGYGFAGYNVYFDTKASALLAPNQLPNAVQVGKTMRECVVKGLENGRHYFFHVRSRRTDGGISAAGLPENETIPQPDGKNYAVSMYDDDLTTPAYNSGYGWNRKNGQDIPGYRNVRQHGKYVDILMVESPTAPNQSIFISPAAVDFTQRWPYRNRTLIADIGTNWVMADSLSEVAFSTTAAIKNGHVYILKTHDNYYVKLRVESVEALNLLLPFGEQRREISFNKITFTYVALLNQSYGYFLTGKP